MTFFQIYSIADSHDESFITLWTTSVYCAGKNCDQCAIQYFVNFYTMGYILLYGRIRGRLIQVTADNRYCVMPTMNGLLSSKLNNTEFLRGIADRKNISFHGTLQPNI